MQWVAQAQFAGYYAAVDQGYYEDEGLDVTIEEGGADIRYSKVLEPEVPPKGDVATIVLNVKAGIGDVEVRRAA